MNVSGARVFITFMLLAGCRQSADPAFEASAIVEGTAVKVAAQTGGYLLQVHVDEGDGVTLDQTLALVDTEKLSYQLEQVQAHLEELNMQQGIAASNQRRAQDDFEYARTRYERVAELFKANAATEQARDDAKINLDRAQAAYESARQNVQALASRKKALAAQGKLLRRQINDGLVKAPLRGTVTTRYYKTGETIPSNAALVEIIDLAQLWTKVYVSEKYLPQIRNGQSATIQIDGTDQKLTGKVAWISSKAEFTPRNILTEESRTALVYAVKVEVDNPDGILKHGMPVTVVLRPAL
ncbi:MAG: HlyD family secretion protein [bacterium]